jgi:hypothetical protein
MRITRQGTYIKPSSKNPIAYCDYTYIPFNIENTTYQYEWRGNSLVWTGFIVGNKFATEPQEQNRPPKPGLTDPTIVKDPRFPNPFIPADANPTPPTAQALNKLLTFNWNESEI